MASYQDSIQSLTQFSPYVQQLPVEQMRAVGQEKQARYDQGVQRIQSQIDNVAGLDVVRDVDKKYLQAKLDDLGTNLKTVAAGDFSNFQLVNSTAGMVGQIAKDKNVLNAVYSTANHRKQLGNIEKAREKGEWGVENEVDYQKQFAAYANSGKVGETFNGQYTPWTDVNKKILAIGKEVGLDETTTQQLFKTDSNGQMLINKSGIPEFNPVMVERHLKGKDPAKLLQAFQTALTPSDYNQLAITGRYVNGSKTPEMLANDIQNGYSQFINSTNSSISSLEIELTKERAQGKPDEERITSLNSQLDHFKNQKVNLESSLQGDVKTAFSNPDSVRASLYTNNYLTKMSKSLSEITDETTYKINPHFEVDMKLKQFDLEQQKFRVSNDHWQKEFDQKNYWEQAKMDADSKGKNFASSSSVEKPLDTTGLGNMEILNRAKDDFSSKLVQQNETNRAIAMEWYKAITPRGNAKNDREYEEIIQQKMYQDAQGSGRDVNVQSGELNAFFSEFAARQAAQWATNPEKTPAKFRGLMEQRDRLTKELVADQALMEDRHSEALEIATAQGVDVSTFQNVQNNIQEIDVPTSSGNAIHLSKDDIYKFVKANPAVFNTLGFTSVSKEQQRDKQIAEQALIAKYGNQYNNIKSYLFPRVSGYGGVSTVTSHPSLRKLSDVLRDSQFEKVAEIEAGLYKKDGDFQTGKIFTIDKGKMDDADYNTRIAAVVQSMQGLTGVEGVNSEDMYKGLLGGTKAVTISVTPGTTFQDPSNYLMTVVTKEGKEIAGKITPENFTMLTGSAPITSSRKPNVVALVDHWKTTDRNGEGGQNSKAPWFTASDFINLKGVDYTVTGNFVQNPSDPGSMFIELEKHNPDNTITHLEYKLPIPKKNADGSYNTQLDNFATMITPAIITSLENQK